MQPMLQACRGCHLLQVRLAGTNCDCPYGPALQIVEALLAAGCRPTVYRGVAPPRFLGCGSELLEVFDPFDFHSPELPPRQAPQCQQ